MSGVPKRSHEEGVTHRSSSSAKYPHEDSGSYPKSTHPPVTPPPPAQVHHHHQQPPHQHPQSQSQSQSHLHTLPHSHSHPHSHPPLAAPSSPYEVESRTVKVARSEPRDGERRSPLQLVYRSPSLPATVSSSDPHLTHTPVPLEPRDGTKEGREIRTETRENRNDGREIYGETKREIQGPKNERDAKFERPGDDFSEKVVIPEAILGIQNLIGRIRIIMNKKLRLRRKRKGMLTWLGKSRRITIEARELLKVHPQI